MIASLIGRFKNDFNLEKLKNNTETIQNFTDREKELDKLRNRKDKNQHVLEIEYLGLDYLTKYNNFVEEDPDNISEIIKNKV